MIEHAVVGGVCLILGFLIAGFFQGATKNHPDDRTEECRKCKADEAYKELTGEK